MIVAGCWISELRGPDWHAIAILWVGSISGPRRESIALSALVVCYALIGLRRVCGGRVSESS